MQAYIDCDNLADIEDAKDECVGTIFYFMNKLDMLGEKAYPGDASARRAQIQEDCAEILEDDLIAAFCHLRRLEEASGGSNDDAASELRCIQRELEYGLGAGPTPDYHRLARWAQCAIECVEVATADNAEALEREVASQRAFTLEGVPTYDAI